MSNGNMAEQIRSMLENGEDIPQNVTNKLILNVMIESHRTREESFTKVDNRIDDVEGQIILNSNEIGIVKTDVGELKTSQNVFLAESEVHQKQNVTLGYLWDKFGLPVIMIILTIIISTFIAANIPRP